MKIEGVSARCAEQEYLREYIKSAVGSLNGRRLATPARLCRHRTPTSNSDFVLQTSYFRLRTSDFEQLFDRASHVGGTLDDLHAGRGERRHLFRCGALAAGDDRARVT